MGALNDNCRNFLTTWSTECPTILSAASMRAQPWLQVPQRYGGKGPSGGGHGSSDGRRLGARAAASFSTTSRDCNTSLARISTWPRLQTWIGWRDCVWCACVSCPHGPAVWLSTSPPGKYSAVLLFVLGSCRCGRHADTLGLADDRQQSFFHMHGEIHRWSLVSTKHSQNVRKEGASWSFMGATTGAWGALRAHWAPKGRSGAHYAPAPRKSGRTQQAYTPPPKKRRDAHP